MRSADTSPCGVLGWRHASLTRGIGITWVIVWSTAAQAQPPPTERVTFNQAIERATYVRARNPKWDPVLFSPPPDLDMPGILPTARHWLVLQGKAAYLILQLDGDNWLKVLETVESRTGIKVDRTKSGGDQF